MGLAIQRKHENCTGNKIGAHVAVRQRSVSINHERIKSEIGIN
jgi:hypothetical protein